MHYRRFRKTGSFEPRRKPTVEERFWAKVDKNGPVPDHAPELGPCWPWTAGKFSDGYGAFAVTRETPSKAHRVSFEWARGPIPEDLLPDHICHEPTVCTLGVKCPHRACVNPDHIKLVPPAENIRRQTRHPRPPRTHCGNGHLLDEANSRWYKGTLICKACVRDSGRRRDEREKRERLERLAQRPEGEAA